MRSPTWEDRACAAEATTTITRLTSPEAVEAAAKAYQNAPPGHKSGTRAALEAAIQAATNQEETQ